MFVLAAPACMTSSRVESSAADREVWLFRAETVIQDRWEEIVLREQTSYRLGTMDGELGIQAVGQNSASGLIRRVHVDTEQCPLLRFAWRVEELQSKANLKIKELEDVAASVFLMFGDPGFLFDPKPVPTLRYVWTNDNVAEGTVVDNPYMSGFVRSLVLRSGVTKLGQWVQEERNLRADFEKAFGNPPEDDIYAIALFTDNDQTKERVEAYYGWAKVDCLKGQES